jgi:hypothetical protein
MIKARHHRFLYPFFEWYGYFLMKMHFKSINITGNYIKDDLPVLVISNHFSWWDGFFISTLNRKIIHKKFHVMMTEEQLLKYWYLSYTGGYSIKKRSKSCFESLRYTISLLEKSENMVTIFPQGRFEPVYMQPLRFQKGIEWVLKHLNNEIRIIFAANLIEYSDSAKPELNIVFKEYACKNKDITEIQDDYNQFYRKSYLDISAHKNQHT